MAYDKVPSGKNPPDDVNVIIEIPAEANPIKYEVDKDTGVMKVDRFMPTAMHYPCNYGYIPHTLCDDEDPSDVLVITPFPVITGSVVQCRPIGVLEMSDEEGQDAKLLCVPVSKLTPMYEHINKPDDFPQVMLDQIGHFFEHYKDLEPGKWVRIEGWKGPDAAREEINAAVKRYQSG